MVAQSHVGVLPECESEEEAIEHLETVFGEIFGDPLDGWYRVPSSWQMDRDFDTFKLWFEWSYRSVIVDLCSDPLF